MTMSKINKTLFKFFILLLCCILFQPKTTTTFADELEQEMQQNRKRLVELQKEIDAQKEKIKEIQNQKNTLQTSLSLLDAQIQKTTLELQEVETELQATSLQIEQINIQLVEKQQELEKQQLLLQHVIRTMYKEGNFSLIESIATSDNLSHSLAQMGYLDIIKERKEAIIAEITVIKANLEETKEKLELQKAEAEKLKEQIEAKKQQLGMEAETKNKLLEETKGVEAEYQNAVRADEEERKKIETNLQRMEAEIARRAREAAEKSAYQEIKGTGRFVRPVPGNITQGFMDPYPSYMYKIFPGLSKYHTGIDFGCAVGTPVKAADTGIVSMVQYSKYGYGNHIVLFHGDGLFTIYGHLSSIAVSANQSISKGQIIGNSGNTGTSTGPHLHWEARLYYTDSNGNRVYKLKNPLSYL